ncbi:uncharacterized protein LOC110032722 [Phalaenopsis equestris]|uniref:uncharacterized protein LOC110032722 n=1 Tax=Phalaenopsis equestris TaxID=78828 RepID=UPI0009E4174B|nr:uncharacterized protein LOC110032722 [Phalaenopsis equestris]
MKKRERKKTQNPNLLPSHSPQISSYPLPPLFLTFTKNTNLPLANSQILNQAAESEKHRKSIICFFLTKMAVISPPTFSAAAISTSALNSTMKKKAGVTFIQGLNSYGGLKAQNTVTPIGVSQCAEKSFAMVMSSIKSSPSKKQKSGGGAFSSTCNAAAEIFKIAAIMNGLVLIGVALGFILLRVEASVEESE